MKNHKDAYLANLLMRTKEYLQKELPDDWDIFNGEFPSVDIVYHFAGEDKVMEYDEPIAKLIHNRNARIVYGGDQK